MNVIVEERRPTVNELANQKGIHQKASGWKIYHLAAQLEEMVCVIWAYLKLRCGVVHCSGMVTSLLSLTNTLLLPIFNFLTKTVPQRVSFLDKVCQEKCNTSPHQ